MRTKGLKVKVLLHMVIVKSDLTVSVLTDSEGLVWKPARDMTSSPIRHTAHCVFVSSFLKENSDKEIFKRARHHIFFEIRQKHTQNYASGN